MASKNSKQRQGRNNQEKILFATILNIKYSKSSSDVCVVMRGVGTRHSYSQGKASFSAVVHFLYNVLGSGRKHHTTSIY